MTCNPVSRIKDIGHPFIFTTSGHSPAKSDFDSDVGSLSWLTAPTALASAVGEVKNPEASMVYEGTEHARLKKQTN